MTESFYLRDGDAVVATVNTQGAWDPNQQHGGVVQALLAHTLDSVETLAPMQMTRLTVDMVKPVPIGEPIWVDTEIVREGKKIQVVELRMRSASTELVRATALRIRIEDIVGRTTLPSTTVAHELELPAPEDIAGMVVPDDAPGRPGFLRAVEMRRFQAPAAPEGVYGWWLRPKVDLFPGEPVRPMSRLMIAADMTNTIGVLIDPTAYSTINPDMNVHVLRPPEGEWVSVVGDTRFCLGAAIGVSNGLLGDRTGVCAVAGTSQLVQLRA